MAQTFSLTISEWVRETEGAAEAVFKQSAQEVLAEAQTPVGAGGSMPVDTGFLRGSLRVGVNGEPADATAIGGGEEYVLQIGAGRIGDILKARWTANYAGYVEYGSQGRPARGFVRKAAQRWPAIVAGVEARLGALIGR